MSRDLVLRRAFLVALGVAAVCFCTGITPFAATYLFYQDPLIIQKSQSLTLWTGVGLTAGLVGTCIAAVVTRLSNRNVPPKLPQPICSNCRSLVPSNAAICPHCGQAVDGRSERLTEGTMFLVLLGGIGFCGTCGSFIVDQGNRGPVFYNYGSVGYFTTAVVIYVVGLIWLFRRLVDPG